MLKMTLATGNSTILFSTILSRLMIKTSTWVRDSHELFDYESPNLLKKTFKIQHSSKPLISF